MTPDEFLLMPDNKGYELIDGVPVERNMSNQASYVQAQLSAELVMHCRSGKIGSVYESEGGYRIFPENRVRRPDVSFIAYERRHPSEHTGGWSTVAPDLAVEVVSANDNADALFAKAEAWLAAGAGEVWVISPLARTLHRWRIDGTTATVRGDGEVLGEGPLEGLRFRLGIVFPPDQDRPAEDPPDGNPEASAAP